MVSDIGCQDCDLPHLNGYRTKSVASKVGLPKGGDVTRVTLYEYATTVRPRYRRARKKEKRRILDEFCQTAGIHGKAAIRLLGRGRGLAVVAKKRGRPPRYGPEVKEALVKGWEGGDRVGRQPRRPASATRGLKAQIPIRTWSEWKDVQPGSVQADLVLHCGESLDGFFLTTLTVVDVATGWTEVQPIWGIGMSRVGGGVEEATRRLPVPLRELHTDNGGEFINHALYDWCQRRRVRFTRGRSYKKNDQAYVEQRNWLAVRRSVGHDRYSSRTAFPRPR